jgi:hypothetical protein
VPRPSRETLTRNAQELNQDLLLSYPNVIGVATGFRERDGKLTDEIVVQVFVERKVAEDQLSSAHVVPQRVTGFEGATVRTDVVETTVPEAQQDTTRYRPVEAGCSIGPEASVSAGTLGGWACDNTDDTIVLLSNNHVISNLDTMPVLRRIVQPGRFDGGVLPGDVIGALKRHNAVNTVANPPPAGTVIPTSVVDAAIGSVDVGVDIDHDVLQIGPAIYELRAPALNMNVQKRGRTTRLTTNGRITSVGMTFNCTYQNRTRISQIQNAFRITSTDGNAFSGAGDSGSLIFDQAAGQLSGTRPVVGLLYGGGAFGNGTPFTDANDINAVFGALNLATVCTCVARAIIRAIFRRLWPELPPLPPIPPVLDFDLRQRERELGRFRSRVLATSKYGRVLDELIAENAARGGKILAEDDEAFEAAVRALAPLAEHERSYLELLDRPIDAKTVESLTELADHVARSDAELGKTLRRVVRTLRRLEGSTLRRVLEVGAEQAPGAGAARRRRA